MIRSPRRPVAALVLTAAVAMAVPLGDLRAALEDPELEAKAKRAVDRGLKWLRAQQQENGSWGNHPGLTALALTAFARSHRAYTEEDGPFMRNGYRYLTGLVKDDGGIYDRDLPVYNTAVSVMALCSARNPRFAPLITDARDFLVGQQASEANGYEPTDKFYGGIGYGNDERPDLSNLQLAVEALAAANLDEEDPAWDRAVRFLERCQNRSESNDQAWAANDGGFVYYPGNSMAGGTKSYGSMTYAGIKSFIHAQMDRNDPRVKEAHEWIRTHYTLEENPMMGAQGLYYYFHTFAKTMRVIGEPVITDADGRQHRWAEDVTQVLLDRQHEDGYWVNDESARWWEGNKLLVTSESVLTLTEAMAELGPSKDACPSLAAAPVAVPSGKTE